MMAKHAELPWRRVYDVILDAWPMPKGRRAKVSKEIARVCDEETAEFIIKACSAHYPMLEALEKAKNFNIDLINMVRGLGIDLEADRNSLDIVLGRQRDGIDAAIATAQEVKS